MNVGFTRPDYNRWNRMKFVLAIETRTKRNHQHGVELQQKQRRKELQPPKVEGDTRRIKRAASTQPMETVENSMDAQ